MIGARFRLARRLLARRDAAEPRRELLRRAFALRDRAVAARRADAFALLRTLVATAFFPRGFSAAASCGVAVAIAITLNSSKMRRVTIASLVGIGMTGRVAARITEHSGPLKARAGGTDRLLSPVSSYAHVPL